MKVRTEFSRPIRVIDTAWIELSDGCRLAARVWLPEDAESDPVPAIVEYMPYRKNDATAARDAEMHPYFAGFGYASIRIDMRGRGDSDGILYDEYLKQEQDDALEGSRWIAAQPWCTGKIGIIGISWGGFNGLQIAARKPPELGGDHRLLDRRSLQRRRPLHRRLPAAGGLVGRRDARLQRAPAGPGARRRTLARDVARAHGRDAAVHRGVGDAPAPRRVLAARLDLRELWRCRVPVYAVGGWTDGYTTPSCACSTG